MKKPTIRNRHGPEHGIQKEICQFLRARGWLVQRMIGNALQYGVPDLYIAHSKWGQRWLECKNPQEWNFTQAQRINFPLWDSYNVGIWILTAATKEEYQKLFKVPNWRDYWKNSWGKINVESLLKELDDEN